MRWLLVLVAMPAAFAATPICRDTGVYLYEMKDGMLVEFGTETSFSLEILLGHHGKIKTLDVADRLVTRGRQLTCYRESCRMGKNVVTSTSCRSLVTKKGEWVAPPADDVPAVVFAQTLGASYRSLIAPRLHGRGKVALGVGFEENAALYLGHLLKAQFCHKDKIGKVSCGLSVSEDGRITQR